MIYYIKKEKKKIIVKFFKSAIKEAQELDESLKRISEVVLEEKEENAATEKEKVLNFIKCMRKYGNDVVDLFTNGYCYYFCIILKERFKEVEIYYDVVVGHMVTKIGDSFFDITGEIEYNDNMKSFPNEIDSLQLKSIIRDVILKEKFL